MSSPGPPWSPPTSILCPVFAVVCWVLVSAGFPSHLKKEIATHSSTLAWKIPWTGEPGRLQSMGSQRVGHD